MFCVCRYLSSPEKVNSYLGAWSDFVVGLHWVRDPCNCEERSKIRRVRAHHNHGEKPPYDTNDSSWQWSVDISQVSLIVKPETDKAKRGLHTYKIKNKKRISFISYRKNITTNLNYFLMFNQFRLFCLTAWRIKLFECMHVPIPMGSPTD